MERKKTCSVVIPVYNSSSTLPGLIFELSSIFKSLFTEYEVILVNDGSKDESWQIIKTLSENNQSVFGINLLRNYGQHNATLTGILQAKYDLILTMDDDQQQSPKDILLLMNKLDEGFDVVYGYPIKKAQHSWRNFASWVIRIALNLATGMKSAYRFSSFRLFRKEICNAFKNYDNSTVLVDVLLSWGTTKFGFVPVQHNERKIGKSNYNFFKLARFAFDLITGFSDWPLKLASLIGVVFSLLGIVVLLYVLIKYAIIGQSVPGFPFLASIIAIFSGAQLLSLGIIGEYLSRIHNRSIGKPVAAIKEYTNNILRKSKDDKS